MPTPTDFAAFHFDQRSNDGTYATHGDAYDGEYGQVNPDSTLPTPETGVYPNIRGYGFDSDNPEFSSNVSGDPMDLAAESANSMSAFADLQWFLNNNLETIGSRVAHDISKPWTPPHGESR